MDQRTRTWVLVAAVWTSAVSWVGCCEEQETAPPQVVGDTDYSVGTLTINVTLTEDGFQPSKIFVPVGRGVRLVLRNQGTTEHHYRVVGLVPRNLLWLSGPSDVQDGSDPEMEHDAHHSAGLVPFSTTSPVGITPLGDQVHVYAAPSSGNDVVYFVATNTGTFEVDCPLHHEVVGTLKVF